MTQYGHTHKFENIGSSRETRTLLPHPPVNPDHASLGFHLFRTLRDAIYGKRFVCDGKVNEEVKKWLQVQNSNLCKKETDALVSCWCKALEVCEDCLENEVCNMPICLSSECVQRII